MHPPFTREIRFIILILQLETERRGAHRAEWGLRREELIMSLDLRLWTRHQDLGDRS